MGRHQRGYPVGAARIVPVRFGAMTVRAEGRKGMRGVQDFPSSAIAARPCSNGTALATGDVDLDDGSASMAHDQIPFARGCPDPSASLGAASAEQLGVHLRTCIARLPWCLDAREALARCLLARGPLLYELFGWCGRHAAGDGRVRARFGYRAASGPLAPAEFWIALHFGVTSATDLTPVPCDPDDASLSLLHARCGEAGMRAQPFGTCAGMPSSCVLTVPLAVEPASPGDDVDLRGRRVLVVDDGTDMAEVMCDYLRLLRAQAIPDTDGARAARMLARLPVDAVLLDLRMPGVDGFTLSRWVRARPVMDSVRLVALSGLQDASAVLRAAACGCDSYLLKPAPLPWVAWEMSQREMPWMQVHVVVAR